MIAPLHALSARWRLARLMRGYALLLLALVALVALLAAMSIDEDWERLQSARAGLRSLEWTRRAIRLADTVAEERAPTLDWLHRHGEGGPGLHAALVSARHRSDEALDQFAAMLQTHQPSPAASTALGQLEAARTRLRQARQGIDRTAGFPLGDRLMPGRPTAPMAIDPLLDSIDATLATATALSVRAERDFPQLAVPLATARYAADLREHAGHLGMHLAALLAARTPFGPEERQELPPMIGRIEQLLQLIETHALGAHDANGAVALREALASLRRSFVGGSLAAARELTTSGLDGRLPELDGDEFWLRYRPGLAAASALRELAIDEAWRSATAERDAAVHEVRNMVAVTVGFLLVELLSLVTFQRWILRPILACTAGMEQVLKGDLDASPPPVERRDEIGALQAALAALHRLTLDQHRLEDERRSLIAELQRSATEDPLTGLPNRRAFDDRAIERVALAWRRDWNVAVMLLDIDHFKRVNDQHGHPTDDAVLVHVAQRLQACLRVDDLVARYGGEEFVVLASDLDAAQAVELAQRICDGIARHPYSLPGHGPLPLTVSIGVATATASHAAIAPMVAAADTALYDAKRAGRNRVVLWNAAPAAKPVPGVADPALG